jgi:hypothetical protein
MNNTATALLRIAALAGGAALGALLARWIDEYFIAQSQQSDEDKLRYAQGLGPVRIKPSPKTPDNIYTIHSLRSEDEEE